MELRRGKTFIKSSVQISHERLTDSPGPAKEEAGPWSLSPGGQQRPCGEKSSQTSPCAQGYGQYPNKEILSDSEGGPGPLCGTTFKLVRKSKTHDSVPGAAKAAAPAGQMVGSASFPETPGAQRMIDYRHFVPQMPFVPAVAKSIPRKRISLKRSKKCFRNLFHIRRSKTENLASLSAKAKNLPSPGVPLGAAAQQGKPFLSVGEGLGLDSLCQDLSDNEFLPDSPFDLCSTLCEDVASLKSFDSLTGCGEIFADGSSVPSVELKEGPENPAHSPQALDSKTPRGPSQGSTEQLASPAQNEASDFTKFWDSVNRSVKQQQRALPWLTSPQATDADQPKLDTPGLAELPLFPCRGPPSGSKASSIDTGTPKSEQPESVSTSDEGYYDSFSPGLEEEKKEAATPGTPAATFPRDSYSGDALYELFYDPSEAPVGPVLEDDLCVSDSLSGPALGTPLSMCSFHVGAEENLAPAPGPDLLSQGFLQSTWKGKECLLKLCDTELAITMGIVNWLRRTPPAPAPAPTPTAAPAPIPALVLREPAAPPDPHKVLRGPAMNLQGREDQALDTGKTMTCLPPSGQEPWAHPGTKDVLVRERKAQGESARDIDAPSKDGFLGEGTQNLSDGRSSSAATMTTGLSRKSKAADPATCPSSQKELGTPGDLRHAHGPLKPGHVDPGPMLVGCVAHVAALQIYPDGHSPRQNRASGILWKPQAWDPNTVQKKPSSNKPSGVAVCGLPSPISPQDLFLDLSQLKLEPSRPGTQACASVVSQPKQLSPRAPEQVPHRGSVGS
ncbi:APC membrane recruitment protein 3 [Acomys russatus]|uniref:APC membrane recruitment protein 3 n=1 Tax=Acomys russatus TaxID=60746 RepID=UPI0021E3296F|nr:APC membrane recruitment protein 3 [Acomys russatus]